MDTKSEKKYNIRTWLIPKLRRLSYQWPPRKWAQTAARVERGKYKCELCSGIFGPREISLDHKEPVIAVDKGFVDWNTYVERLFCEFENWSVICNNCHDKKTEQENIQRKQYLIEIRENKAKKSKSKRKPKRKK